MNEKSLRGAAVEHFSMYVNYNGHYDKGKGGGVK